MGAEGTRSGPVTAEAVIDAALALIDAEGLDALTMRRLAHDLGVEPVTIYRHLPNKEAILAGVAEKLWRDLRPAPPAPDWRGDVRAMWMSLHGLMQAHPNAIPVIAKGATYSATAGGGTAAMADVFRRAGLTPKEAAELLHILAACVVGFGFAALWSNQIAAGQRQERPAGAAEAGDGAAAGPTAPAGEPAVASDELQPYLAALRHWEPAQFEKALDIVLGAYGESG